MSHISKIELEVKDLGILGQACSELGLQLIRNRRTFRWYGKESPCDHAIRVPGANYEIGVTQRNDLFELNCDFYDRNLEKVIGSQGGLLKQAYAVIKPGSKLGKKDTAFLSEKLKTVSNYT